MQTVDLRRKEVKCHAKRETCDEICPIFPSMIPLIWLWHYSQTISLSRRTLRPNWRLVPKFCLHMVNVCWIRIWRALGALIVLNLLTCRYANVNQKTTITLSRSMGELFPLCELHMICCFIPRNVYDFTCWQISILYGIDWVISCGILWQPLFSREVLNRDKRGSKTLIFFLPFSRIWESDLLILFGGFFFSEELVNPSWTSATVFPWK